MLNVSHCAQNIDTDQIIPAEYLTLVPSKVWGAARCSREAAAAAALCSDHWRCDVHACPQPDEYEKLGSYALIGLPDDLYPTR